MAWNVIPVFTSGELIVASDFNGYFGDNLNLLKTGVNDNGVPIPVATQITSSATPTPAGDACNYYEITALAVAATFGAPTGSPANGRDLIIAITDNGTSWGLTWASAYADGGTALPTATVAGKTMFVGFIYKASLSKWLCVDVAIQG